MNSIGSEGAHWPVIGHGCSKDAQHKKDKAMAPPKRIASMEEDHSMGVRPLRGSESMNQTQLHLKSPLLRESSILFEI
jgi:hypothetical protein